ncbi:ATP-grasp domain-containing protein [Winogradskyella bathintestinalis]|uniref:ATP-grasp domain-containing protein n=1 Tax=Winogradskyella bathintestinalis TaxID=3035208 RepID=A0ABT7ZRX8_9FLAO|nr:ATP-grasp domain-containing protein [Winogradskyella bathintestinalis]MDN3491737.1 ATP-grasp domain-containing protein [Winogradskyella bathintestinalis]
MNICFVISDIKTEAVGTSVVLMKKAHERGHTLYIMGVGDFIFHHNAPMSLRCTRVKTNLEYENADEFWAQIQEDAAKKKVITSKDLDVLFLRNNPTEEADDRRWAEHSGIAFARMIQQEGVLVLNDAYAMSHAYIDKLYFEELPSSIKPDSLVTRDIDDLLQFWEEVGKKMVLKPLEGSGGQNVYLIDEDKKNLTQIFNTISSQGYVIAQEFLPEVSKGDVRIILMNGKVLEENGEKAVIRRVNSDKDEFRSNIALGAKVEKTEYTKEMQKIVEVTAPKLINDGLFFVGLDIVNDKLIEINVLSPGGMEYFESIGLPSFTTPVIEAIERKIEYKKLYNNKMVNKVLATMD